MSDGKNSRRQGGFIALVIGALLGVGGAIIFAQSMSSAPRDPFTGQIVRDLGNQQAQATGYVLFILAAVVLLAGFALLYSARERPEKTMGPKIQAVLGYTGSEKVYVRRKALRALAGADYTLLSPSDTVMGGIGGGEYIDPSRIIVLSREDERLGEPAAVTSDAFAGDPSVLELVMEDLADEFPELTITITTEPRPNKQIVG